MLTFLISPFAKLLLIVAVVAAIFGTGYWRGARAIQTRWDVAIAQQAVKSAETVVRVAENTAQIVTKYIQVRGKTQVRTETVEKEVIRYVEAQHPACFIANEFEWVWDDLSRMRGADTDNMPPLADPSSRTDGGNDSGLTTVEILSAHAADAQAYYELRDRYIALVEWVQTSYALQQEGARR